MPLARRRKDHFGNQRRFATRAAGRIPERKAQVLLAIVSREVAGELAVDPGGESNRSLHDVSKSRAMNPRYVSTGSRPRHPGYGRLQYSHSSPKSLFKTLSGWQFAKGLSGRSRGET